jgi:hypothetical protein
MRLKKLNYNAEKYNTYESEQRMVLSSIMSRINRIGDFFDVIVKLEKFVLEEVREEYAKLIEVRDKKKEIVSKEGATRYINNYFMPVVNTLNNKIEQSIKSWNHVEREYATGKVYGFISAVKNFYKELDAFDDEDDLNESPMTSLIKEILDNFGRFKMYKAIMSDDIVVRMETLLSMQKDILENNSGGPKEKKITLDDL